MLVDFDARCFQLEQNLPGLNTPVNNRPWSSNRSVVNIALCGDDSWDGTGSIPMQNNRTENDLPMSTPVKIRLGGIRRPFILIRICLPKRMYSVYLTTHTGAPLMRRMRRGQYGLILSNALDRSKDKTRAGWSLPKAAWISWSAGWGSLNSLSTVCAGCKYGATWCAKTAAAVQSTSLSKMILACPVVENSLLWDPTSP